MRQSVLSGSIRVSTPHYLIVEGYRGGADNEHDAVNARVIEARGEDAHVEYHAQLPSLETSQHLLTLSLVLAPRISRARAG